jgi:hypothetical protein
VYRTQTGGLKRSPVASPSPTSLLTGTDVAELLEVSPDGNWLVYWSTSKLPVLVATTAPATPIAIPVTGTETSLSPGDWFTADSKNVLFFTNTIHGDNRATLSVMSISTRNVTNLQATVYEAAAIGGGEVLLGFVSFSGGYDGQLLAVDVTAGTAPRIVAASAVQTGAGGFALSPDKKLVAYHGGASINGGLFITPTH